MLKGYFKVALRNLLKHRIFSFINILGLSIGMAGCMVIALYIYEETQYDKFHADHERIYRVTRKFMSPDGSTSLELATLAPPFAPLLANDYPQMENVARIIGMGQANVSVNEGEDVYYLNNLTFADANIFDVLSINLTTGDQEQVLSKPGSVIITPEVAAKLFGDKEALGKVIRIFDQFDVQVTGIFEPFPHASHIHPELIVDMYPVVQFYGGKEAMMSNWGSNNFYTYFKLKEGQDLGVIKADLPDFVDRHIDENASDWTSLGIQPIADIHLHSHLDAEYEGNGDITYIYTFAGIALLILLIACINYMNLSTARASSRAKEVGLRKVLGAFRTQLIRQFLTESVLVVLIAVLISSGLLSLVLPWFRDITGNPFEITVFNSVWMILGLFAFAVITGILAGSYPAFFLSKFRPSRVLKGDTKTGAGGSLLRRVLVVTQFSISVVLIFSTVIIMEQISYIQQKNLGFNKETIVTIGTNMPQEQKDQFRQQLESHPGVKRASFTSRVPSGKLLDSSGAEAEVGDEMITPDVVIKVLRVDEAFIDAYEVPVIAGRNFDPTIITDDTGAFILNRAATEMIGYQSPQEALGKRFSYNSTTGQIIGVIEDIHFEGLQNAIGPIVLQQGYYSDGAMLSVKLEAAATADALAFIEKEWTSTFPAVPFSYRFLDERFRRLYEAEQTRSQLFTGFSFLAIFLACLGLLGLASFTVSRRYKEINIRKVLGAPLGSLLYLLSREFVILVCISFLLAFPIGIYAMSNWLESYAYRIDIGILPFVYAAIIALGAALLTVSLQTYKAVQSNPASALRDE